MKLSQKQIRKLSYQLLLVLLATGASLILGFLSFGGMFALWPILPLAWGAFALSVAYEGEIYLQNIRGALKKLLKPNIIQRQVSREFLLEKFPDTSQPDCPQFFKDYEAQLKILNQFADKNLDKESKKRKKHAEKTLKTMEKWFAKEMFAKRAQGQTLTPCQIELQTWLSKQGMDQWAQKAQKRGRYFMAAKAFSAIAGVFMGVGTTYLLVEAFTVIPAFAAISFSLWPAMIIPMAVVAGAAYALLTYNSITDMISNNTLAKWYNKIKNDLKQGLTPKNIFMALTAALLVTMAVLLTICTAGTWWTVVKEARPLFSWMTKIPGFVMGVINPIITGISAVVFNLQNTSETLEMIDEAIQPHDAPQDDKKPTLGFWGRLKQSFTQSWDRLKQGFTQLLARENWGQILNPFRLILKLTFTPLRILLFLGHLVSIAVTSDRVPGIPQIVSAIFGLVSEGFEDAHYFLPHTHHHAKDPSTQDLLKDRLEADEGHSHENDLPTRLLKVVFAPLFALSAGWDTLFSRANKGGLASRQTLTFSQAWSKACGHKPEQTVEVPSELNKPSARWHKAHAIYRLEKHQTKHLQKAWLGQDLAQQKHQKLGALKQRLFKSEPAKAHQILREKPDPVFSKHRFFNNGETETAAFLRTLPEKISGPAA